MGGGGKVVGRKDSAVGLLPLQPVQERRRIPARWAAQTHDEPPLGLTRVWRPEGPSEGNKHGTPGGFEASTHVASVYEPV